LRLFRAPSLFNNLLSHEFSCSGSPFPFFVRSRPCNPLLRAQNKGTYIPEGLTKAQYDAQLKKEAEAKAKKQSKFKIGKEPETLTEWMLKEKAKGNEGKGLLLKGHRMVKAKYDGWYTNESPV